MRGGTSLITFALKMRGGYSSCVIIFTGEVSGDGWKVGKIEIGGASA